MVAEHKAAEADGVPGHVLINCSSTGLKHLYLELELHSRWKIE